jgi:hypothetical protein
VLELAGPRVLCHDDEHAPTSVVINETGDGLGGQFDLQGATMCVPFRFQAYERVTVFSFVNPNWAQHLKVFPQHTMLFLLFTPNPASSESPPPLVAQQWPEDFHVLDLDRSLVDTHALHCMTPEIPLVLGNISDRRRTFSAIANHMSTPLSRVHWSTRTLECTVERKGGMGRRNRR